MKTVQNILDSPINFLMRMENRARVYYHHALSRNPYLAFAARYLSLGKMVVYALVAVAAFHFLNIRFSSEMLSFLQRDLFFQPLNMVIPVLLATAMFAVPQRTPIKILATIGISVIVTYLLTTLFSSSIGYGSVALFDTAQYLKPMLSVEVQGNPKQFKTDFSLLIIIAVSLLSSIVITLAVKRHHKLQQQIVFLSIYVEKLAYILLATILWMMPFAVFASISHALQMHGVEKLANLGWFVLYVTIPQIFYLFLLICLLKIGTGASFTLAFSAIKALAKVALPSASSAATILINVETARRFPILKKYKNKGLIASIIPFGATVNMDGTALFITIMCKIGADIQGIDISYWEIVPYSVVYSCAAAAVPSASIVLITAIYTIIGIDSSITVQVLGLMIAVDWVNDRVRTLVNVSGDLMAVLLSLNERSPLQLALKLVRSHVRS